MLIETEEDFLGMSQAGRIVRAVLREMKRHVRAGITTAELNHVGAAVMRKHGARSAPMLVYQFPAEICISVNDEIVHGIPSKRIVRKGDLVKLDVTMEKDGYMADAAITVAVEPITDENRMLMACARRAFEEAMKFAREGNRVYHIGRAVEGTIKDCGFSVIRDLTGHGIGRTLHEDPEVPNYYEPSARQKLKKGLVIAVEPMLAVGSGKSVQGRDGWTISTADGSMAAHYEHTIAITDGKPILLTAA